MSQQHLLVTFHSSDNMYTSCKNTVRLHAVADTLLVSFNAFSLAN